jgi:hypothetical protein
MLTFKDPSWEIPGWCSVRQTQSKDARLDGRARDKSIVLPHQSTEALSAGGSLVIICTLQTKHAQVANAQFLFSLWLSHSREMQNRERQPREAGQLELLIAATLELLALSS